MTDRHVPLIMDKPVMPTKPDREDVTGAGFVGYYSEQQVAAHHAEWEAYAAQLDAEIDRLRGALEESHALSVARRRLLAAEARAERLAEALEACLETEERPKVIELAKAAPPHRRSDGQGRR